VSGLTNRSPIAATIAVDLGNSAAKWCVDDQLEQRISLRSTNWVESLIQDATAAANGHSLSWRIASVNRPITKLLVGRLLEEEPAADVRAISCDDIPMVAKVVNPDRVGIDRLLAAWMASRLYPGVASVVVDAGSAITVDLVSKDAEFLGGVILPGIALQFDSLARGTDALPAIDLPLASETSTSSLPIPATDTVSAIRSGILLGAAAAIDGLVHHLESRVDENDLRIVFTGGDAELLSRLSTVRHDVLPRLVLDAIRALP
jgi:type III pantothenate kinase